MDDTIFALASARGRAGVSVVRLSGPASWAAVAALAGDVPAARRASLRVLRAGGDVLDTALVIAFERGRSFTGEESAELHLHGSVATVAAVLSALGELRLRPAEPGEFTRRALENGRLDLTQVEGLADLIDAETEAQRRQALRVLSGAVGRRAASWRDGLLRAAALVEATIDFADEDIPLDVRPEVGALLDSVHADLVAEKRGFQAAERIREGFEVAIVGEPNAGKSTLLNRLAGRDAAITSEIAGTTRDVIEVRMDIGGMAVTLLDTAGLRGTADPVEAMGVERAIRRAEAADLRVFLSTGTVFPMLVPGGDDIVVQAKGDLGARARAGAGAGLPGVSGLTGLGVDWLVAEIGRRLQPLAAGPSTATRARQRRAVERAIAALERARALLDGASPELVAEEIRDAVRGLDFLIGRIDVEDVLGEIFGSFCIGK